MAPSRVLILGGTTEGRHLAATLLEHPDRVITTSSLAGRTSSPLLPAGEVRIGGFGGAEGLAGFLRDERIDAVVDATHPFATTISRNARAATTRTAVPLLILRRPGWAAGPDDRWHRVPDLDSAASRIPGLGTRVFLTTGRQGIGAFAGLDSCWFLARSVEPPAPPRPGRLEVLLARGPFTVDGEREVLREHRIDLLVTKDSGGPAPKLTAARELKIPVIVVDRPPVLDAAAVETVDQAVHWLLTRLP
jgi:precorrin-6A/cobalt-precorrin-6A reductase